MHCKAFTAHILNFSRKILFANILLMVYQVYIASIERNIIPTYPEDDIMSETLASFSFFSTFLNTSFSLLKLSFKLQVHIMDIIATSYYKLITFPSCLHAYYTTKQSVLQ